MITSTSEKAKIGVMGCGHREYWNQFPGMIDEYKKYTNMVSGYVKSSAAELLDTCFIDNEEDAIAFGRKLNAEGCDLLFVYIPAYIASGRYMQGIIAAKCPFVLIGMQDDYSLDGEVTMQEMTTRGGPCALPEAYSACVRCGLTPAGVIFGISGNNERVIGEVHEWCRAANAMHAFKGSRFGYIGHSYEGMLDMNFDPTGVTKTFGAYVTNIEMCEIVKNINACTEEELEEKIAEIREKFDVVEASYDSTTKPVEKEDLEWSAKVAVGLDKIVKDHSLSGLVYYYMGEDNNIYERAASNFMVGNTLMTSQGIAMAGEADMKTCLAMYLTSALGCGGSFAEMTRVDFSNDVLLVGHDGPHDIRISAGKPTIRGLNLLHGKKGYGASVEFSIKHGPMTMVAFGTDVNGEYRLIVAEGESQEGWVPKNGNTVTRGYFGPDVARFVEDWCAALPPHHASLSIGHNGSLIDKFGKLAGIEVYHIR